LIDIYKWISLCSKLKSIWIFKRRLEDLAAIEKISISRFLLSFKFPFILSYLKSFSCFMSYTLIKRTRRPVVRIYETKKKSLLLPTKQPTFSLSLSFL